MVARATAKPVDGPLVIKSTGKAKERVVLFTIDDKEYTVPANPGMKVALKFLNEMKNSDNEMYGMLQLLEDMLGKEDYATFLDYDELTDELIGDVANKCIAMALESNKDSAGK